jgi:hypothetical protein
MRCHHCQATVTTERADQAELGYRRFRCRACTREFNERTGTPFNRLQYLTDVICLAVLWRFRYKLSLRDVAEMFLQRGLVFTHEAVRDWEMKLAPAQRPPTQETPRCGGQKLVRRRDVWILLANEALTPQALPIATCGSGHVVGECTKRPHDRDSAQRYSPPAVSGSSPGR